LAQWLSATTNERFQLRYGPYKTPRFKYGKMVQDEWRGEVTIAGLSSGRIAWHGVELDATLVLVSRRFV
jgi:hypothetical protein